MNELLEIKDQLPDAVYQKVKAMDASNQMVFIAEFKRRCKTTRTAYLFWLIANIAGLHYLYLKKPLLFILFLITFGGFLIWWFVDLFRIPELVKNYNNTMSLSILRDIQILS